ncbi:MAG TPA: YidB family protein [Casimicrobiaceae bacterium]|nr:YidB family protein [Casimicrobiaceae bacterium]
MGLLDGLLGSVLGSGAQQSQGSMLQIALQVIEQNGGLPGVISKFEHGGMADHVASWVGTGANMPISGAQLQEILGSGSIGEIAQRLGLSHADASSGLARVLPQVIDKMTPDGQVPADQGDIVARARALLEKMNAG